MLGLSGDRLKQIHEKQLQENSAQAPLKPVISFTLNYFNIFSQHKKLHYQMFFKVEFLNHSMGKLRFQLGRPGKMMKCVKKLLYQLP